MAKDVQAVAAVVATLQPDWLFLWMQAKATKLVLDLAVQLVLMAAIHLHSG